MRSLLVVALLATGCQTSRQAWISVPIGVGVTGLGVGVAAAASGDDESENAAYVAIGLVVTGVVTTAASLLVALTSDD